MKDDRLLFFLLCSMGKTIQTIALILSDYDPNVRKNTLVLAPTVAIIQWRNEIEKFTKGMKVSHNASLLADIALN